MGTTTNENGLARPGSWGNGVVSCLQLPLAALSNGRQSRARAHLEAMSETFPPFVL